MQMVKELVSQSLDQISDQELHKNICSLAREERRITADVIRHLEEIDRRKLFAVHGYSSLFAYCLKELSYSESQAYRRINAMRLSRQVPEVSEAIENGRIHVTTASLAQDFFRLEKRERGKVYTQEEKREVLKELSGKTKREAEVLLAERRPEIAVPETKRVLPSGLTQIQFAADPELMRKLEQVRDLFAHQLADGSQVALIEKMTDFVLKKLRAKELNANTEVNLLPAPGKVAAGVGGVASVADRVSAADSACSRYIPAAVRREVWSRDGGRCTHIQSNTGQRCACTYGLEIDHKLPWAMGGPNTADNLRLLCRAHNARAAVVLFGKRD